jgi:3-hydroxybutyryl-CoA dehydrogenase
MARSDWVGLEADGAQLRLTDGRCAAQIATEGKPQNIAVFDLPLAPDEPGAVLAWAPAQQASAAWVATAEQWLRALGFHPQRIADAPGLVVARTVAMLINEAGDAVHQGVCSAADADAAMKLGVNYPAGPFEWLARWDAASVIGVLTALDEVYRGQRYRISPWLRQRAWADVPPAVRLSILN